MIAGILAMLVLPILAATRVIQGEALDRVLRVSLVFVTLLVVFRVIGKRELSKLSPFELVTLMLIPEVLSNTVQSEGSVLDALTGLSTLFLLVLVTSVLAHRFERFERAVEPGPTLLVADGRVLEDALNEQRIVVDELMSEMRKQGILELSEVRLAVLEGGGNITFVPKHSGVHPARDDERPTA
jgi:uncharacterized membrane protein YcaP (DUF421 family)